MGAWVHAVILVLTLLSIPSKSNPPQDDLLQSGFPKLDVCTPEVDSTQSVASGSVTLLFQRYSPANMITAMTDDVRRLGERRGFRVAWDTDITNSSYRVLVTFEEPNFLLYKSPEELDREEGLSDHTLTMCPYTAVWGNTRLARCKRTPMWLAVPPALKRPFVPLRERRDDILYMSDNTLNGPVMRVLQTVFPKFKSRWFSARKVPEWRKQKIQPTDVAQGLEARLATTANTRTALIVNALFLDTVILPARLPAYRQRPALASHGAFVQVQHVAEGGAPPLGYTVAIPQMKARTFEAAMTGALMLVFADGLDIIERFYVPGEEFVYWHNTSDLVRILTDVVANPDAYDPIARRAYDKTWVLYTTERWVERLVMPLVPSAPPNTDSAS